MFVNVVLMDVFQMVGDGWWLEYVEMKFIEVGGY